MEDSHLNLPPKIHQPQILTIVVEGIDVPCLIDPMLAIGQGKLTGKSSENSALMRIFENQQFVKKYISSL